MRPEFDQYAKKNGYPVSLWEEIACTCGSKEQHLYSDDIEGGAYLLCSKCGNEIDIESSKRYIESADHNICSCEQENLTVYVGKSYYEGSEDIRWVYVAAQCSVCDVAGVYVDWQVR